MVDGNYLVAQADGPPTITRPFAFDFGDSARRIEQWFWQLESAYRPTLTLARHPNYPAAQLVLETDQEPIGRGIIRFRRVWWEQPAPHVLNEPETVTFPGITNSQSVSLPNGSVGRGPPRIVLSSSPPPAVRVGSNIWVTGPGQEWAWNTLTNRGYRFISVTSLTLVYQVVSISGNTLICSNLNTLSYHTGAYASAVMYLPQRAPYSTLASVEFRREHIFSVGYPRPITTPPVLSEGGAITLSNTTTPTQTAYAEMVFGGLSLPIGSPILDNVEGALWSLSTRSTIAQ